MSNGGVIGTPNDPTGAGAPGVWSLDEAYQAARSNKWPSVNHVVSGGTVTTITESGTTYNVHTFTSPGIFTVSTVGYSAPTTADYLVIAGGGGSHINYGLYGVWQNGGGGGGAGGYREGTTTLKEGSFPVTVGAGGALTTSGGPSVLSWSPAPISATGGGAGGSSSNGTPGGSGGGGGKTPGPTVPGGSAAPGQGFPGGSGDSPGGGGGGGAGGAGGNYPVGAPGLGKASSISGTSVTYAVGGGGGPNNGRGSTAGSGGAAGPSNSYTGNNGIVIVRYVVV